ncbi:MAG: YHS domain-containing protein [Bacteroidetes bacterium]|nr:YHS domain-containing protein [Bacteroidota bacterium]
MDVKANVKTVSHDGKDYGFCCAGCVDKFSADPEKFGKQLNEDGSTLLKN